MRVSSDVQDYPAMVPESQLLSSELEALPLRQSRSCYGWANNARVRETRNLSPLDGLAQRVLGHVERRSCALDIDQLVPAPISCRTFRLVCSQHPAIQACANNQPVAESLRPLARAPVPLSLRQK